MSEDDLSKSTISIRRLPDGDITEETVILPERRESEKKSFATLRIVSGRDAYRVCAVYEGERVIVGRDRAADLVLTDSSVSRRHLAVTCREDGVYVDDLGSSNGTFYRGRSVTEPTLVETGTAWDTDALQGLDSVARAAKAFSFRSTHREVKAYDRDWPDGAASPGLVQVSFMREPESMDAAGAAAYWVEHHAPLAVRVHVGLWRYAQNVLDEAVTVGAPGWYGVAELHFASWADFETKFYDSDDGRDAIFADVARFVDVLRSTSALMTERILRS